jgi:hypothetical protein
LTIQSGELEKELTSMEKKTAVGEQLDTGFSRRDFIGSAALAGALLAACGSPPVQKEDVPKLVKGPKVAPDGAPLKAGLIGCGGRGTGAAGNFLDAGPNLHVVAMADIFEDRIQTCRERLKESKGVEVVDSMCCNASTFQT